MTGGDRALISSLEGFEDLQLIGRLQLQDRGVGRGDVVICVTEGGETSSVIGTILAALEQWKDEAGYDPAKSRRASTSSTTIPTKSFFRSSEPQGHRRAGHHQDQPDDRAAGDHGIDPDAGDDNRDVRHRGRSSRRWPAALGRTLAARTSRLGFGPGTRRRGSGISTGVLDSVKDAVPALAPFTDMEAAAYAAGRFSTYFAGEGLVTVFIDSTERSPTFRLFPLDTVREPRRKCWIQVWTEAPDARSAWTAFLGRPFRGLDPAIYESRSKTRSRTPG